MSLGLTVDARLPASSSRLRLYGCLLASLACLGSSGCTALVSTASLRETVRSMAGAGAESAADEVESVATDDDAEAVAEPLVLVKPTAASAEQTIDEAIERLAEAGRLDDAAQAALISMLEQAPQSDWPEIIDAFVEALDASHLDASHVVAKPVAAAPPPAVEPAAPPAVVAPPIVAAPVAEPVTSEPPLLFPVEAVTPMVFPISDQLEKTTPTPAKVIEPIAAVTVEEPPQPALVVANACFATRVRGWGAVDRFESHHFRPGQDVIVYFELENLEARATDAGYTTKIDTSLRLVTDDGRPLHDWSFEPVEETCPARRRDYFARYVLRLPVDASPQAGCRLEVSVTDTVADRTAVASLPLDITAR